jgi:ABC-type transport system involved in multi-copper enzyme maturation permease subunit
MKIKWWQPLYWLGLTVGALIWYILTTFIFTTIIAGIMVMCNITFISFLQGLGAFLIGIIFSFVVVLCMGMFGAFVEENWNARRK